MEVSIQVVSLIKGEIGWYKFLVVSKWKVSIQVVSLIKGEVVMTDKKDKPDLIGFHSSSFPHKGREYVSIWRRCTV